MKPKSISDKVREFQAAFCPHLNQPEPNVPSADICLHRIQCHVEETGELADAMGIKDKAEVLDALIDMQYFLTGTILACGMADVFDDAFDEVHAANMAKLGPDGKPILSPSGRVMKPKDWVPPDLRKFVEHW